MELQHKPDFDEALERLEAWWDCRIIDRPPVTIHVRPERQPELPRKEHPTIRDRWFDFEHKLDRFEASLDGAVFLGESFPKFDPGLGPEQCATVFGCELEFSETTSWSIPVVASCRDILGIRADLNNVYWNNVRAATDMSIERGRGRWITALPDLHTNGDLPAALRDPQELCLELADDIEAVRAACDYVTEVGYQYMYDDMWRRIEAAGQPCTTWAPFLHAGRAYVTSCDFICMISPEMFRHTILPSIVWEMRFLERNFFHLDGPGALRHLDDLLAQPELDGLQWVYGAGNGPARKWIDVYRRAQAAGKCIQLVCEDLTDARTVAEHLRPEGVWFCPGGQYSREDAESFIAWADAWAAGKDA
ncbi:MAG: hypothetical protein WBF17_05350 [Phycisphaerae bacterium]